MRNNKGFAISGMIYPILILAIFLIVELLVTLQSRKMILDKNKNDLVTEINNSERVYSNGAEIYFNPETNKLCKASEAKSTTGTKTGCMKWHIFNDEAANNSVTAILDHNTTASVAWNSTGENATGMKEVKTALENDTKTWNKNLKPRLIEANEIARITGNIGFDASNPDKDNWFYFDTNAQTNPNLGQGASRYKWLFNNTKGCTSWGCDVADANVNGYWTGTASRSNTIYAWRVRFSGDMGYPKVNDATEGGVRPVITISKSIFS